MMESPAGPVRLRQTRTILRTIVFLTLLLGVGAAGYFCGRAAKPGSQPAPEAASPMPSDSAKLLKPGPWGKIECVPMLIAAPAEILPVREYEQSKPQWVFAGYSNNEFTIFVDGLDLPADMRQELLSGSMLEERAGDITLTPSREWFFSLPPKARNEIYRVVAGFSENESQLLFLRTSSLDERFHQTDVSPATVALFDKLSCTYGDYRVLAGLPFLLSEIPDYAEKARFIKALTSQRTFLLRLFVGPDSDTAALASYWGRACWATDTKAMLDSLAHLPGGNWIGLANLLPPLPSANLYTFPLPEAEESGPPIRKDCHWTAFNFFRDPPDDRFADNQYLAERIKLDYYPVTGDPRYGDVVLFFLPDNSLIHSAVFLADDVVYTKNGDTPLHPWMFSTIPELRNEYTYRVPPGQQLIVKFYRCKYY